MIELIAFTVDVLCLVGFIGICLMIKWLVEDRGRDAGQLLFFIITDTWVIVCLIWLLVQNSHAK